MQISPQQECFSCDNAMLFSALALSLSLYCSTCPAFICEIKHDVSEAMFPPLLHNNIKYISKCTFEYENVIKTYQATEIAFISSERSLETGRNWWAKCSQVCSWNWFELIAATHSAFSLSSTSPLIFLCFSFYKREDFSNFRLQNNKNA